MRKFTVLFLASVFILAFTSVSFAVTEVSGYGEIQDGNIFIDILNDIGIVAYRDSATPKDICGAITSITPVSSTKVEVSGTYKTEAGTDVAYNIAIEDLGQPGAGIDKFTISDGNGYSRSATITSGEITIVQ